jgi:hypothetical protein
VLKLSKAILEEEVVERNLRRRKGFLLQRK